MAVRAKTSACLAEFFVRLCRGRVWFWRGAALLPARLGSLVFLVASFGGVACGLRCWGCAGPLFACLAQAPLALALCGVLAVCLLALVCVVSLAKT